MFRLEIGRNGGAISTIIAVSFSSKRGTDSMETQSKNAQVFLRVQKTGYELPFWRLMRTGLILARMDQPGPMLIEIRSEHSTIVTAAIDGREVLKTEPMLTAGRHELTSPDLAVALAECSVQPAVVAETTPEDDFLTGLGVEPDTQPKVVMPYIGEPGGVLKIRIAYFRFDNDTPYEFDSDLLIFKISSKSAFLRAVAENAHRIEIERDPDLAKHGNLCGLASHFDPECGHNH